MVALKYNGSTSTFSRVRPGVILKSPTQVWKESSSYDQLTRKFALNFSIERRIYEKVGDHPTIVKFVLLMMLV